MPELTTQQRDSQPPLTPAVETGSVHAPGDGRGGRIFEIAQTLLVSLALALAVRVGIAQAYEVDGPSMEPTLVTGEKLLVARCAYGLSLPGFSEQVLSWALPEVGDVVILASPQNLEEDLVKRVVGLPGDVIEVREDLLYRNGDPLLHDGPHTCAAQRFGHMYAQCETYHESDGSDDTWQITHSYLGWGQTLPPTRVPEGHVYVMGDHRTRSNDSRAFGPVRASLLRGKVLFID